MANNRMVLLCNVCQPDDDWYFGENGVLPVAKWYPAGGFIAGDDGAYYFNATQDWAIRFQEFLSAHQHREVPSEYYRAGAGQENPVRLEYESTGKPILTVEEDKQEEKA